MTVERLNPSGLSTPSGYVHVTVSGPGRLVHVAGQVAKDIEGRTVGIGDLARQTEQVYANLRIALQAASADLRDVVKLVTYMVDLTSDKVAIVRAVRTREMGKGPFPASTLVGVSALAAPEFLIEIEAIAAIA